MSTVGVDPFDVLAQRRARGITLGTDAVARVYDALLRPGDGLPTIHVVGTNGKGSTAALIERGLRRTGARTGLLTSPHLHSLTERVRVDGEPVSRAELGHALSEVLRAEGDTELSFFELLTLGGLVALDRAAVTVRIVEAGLGGVGDATAVVSAQTLVVTSIDLDHCAVLGSDRAAIARNKVGVTRGGQVVVSGPQAAEVTAVLREVTTERGAVLREVEPVVLAASAPVEQVNAAVALAAARTIEARVQLGDVVGGALPGRGEWAEYGGGWIGFDVAHNPAAIAAMVAGLVARGESPEVVVVGTHPDKDRGAIVRELGRLGAQLWWAPPQAETAAAPPGLRSFASVADPTLRAAVGEVLAGGGRVLACGSHGVVGPLRAWALGLDERIDTTDPRVVSDREPTHAPATTRAIDLRIAAARRMGAEVESLDPDTDYLFSVTLDGQTRVLLGGVSPLNDAAAAALCSDKFHTATVLSRAGYRVPHGVRCLRSGRFEADEYTSQLGLDPAHEFAEAEGFPLIVKPNRGSRGRGVVVVRDTAELDRAVAEVWRDDYLALVQRPVPGVDLRVDMLGEQCVFAYARKPLQLVGDGRRSVAELFASADERFDVQWCVNVLPRQPQWQAVVRERGIGIDTVLGIGQMVEFDPWVLNLNRLCAWSVVEVLPERWREHCAGIGRRLGLVHFGVDFKTVGVEGEPREAVVVEVNGSPSLLQMARLGHYRRVLEVEERVVGWVFGRR